MSAADDPSFEQALDSLETLVGHLERGDLSLEDSLLTFEEGVKLVRLCSERLRTAELRIRQLEETPRGPEERDVEVDE